MDEWQQDNHTKRKQQPSPPCEVAAATQNTALPDCHSPQTQLPCSPDDTRNTSNPTSTGSTAAGHAVFDVERSNVCVDGSMSLLVTDTPSWNHLSPPGAFDWGTSSFAFDHNGHDLGSASSDVQLNAIMWDVSMSSVADGRPHLANPTPGPFLSNILDSHHDEQRNLDLATPLSTLLPHDMNEFNPALIFATQQQAAPLIHQLLPQILEPDTPGDERIQSIIKRAQAQGTRLGSPTLADFLCENPDNVLSMGIKHYLEPVRKTRRIIEFLATYWVLYLLLRVSFY